jgi:hypothetical protein
MLTLTHRRCKPDSLKINLELVAPFYGLTKMALKILEDEALKKSHCSKSLNDLDLLENVCGQVCPPAGGSEFKI